MKKLYCLILLFSIGKICNAQVPDWEWSRSAACFDTSGYGLGLCVETDKYENVYAAGVYGYPSVSFDTITLSTQNIFNRTIYLAKYDSAGNVIWAKTAGGLANGWVYDITCDNAGNIYMIGTFEVASLSFGSITLTYSGSGYNLFLVKYDSSGNVLWAKSAGGSSGNDYGMGVTTDASGNVIITGCFSTASITFGSYTFSLTGYYNSFIVKYDASGNVLWAQQPMGFHHIGKQIACDLMGNIYVSGDFQFASVTIGSYTLLNTGVKDIFISKYDSSGNVLWAKSAGGTLEDQNLGMDIYSTGNVFITGYFDSPSITFGSFTLSNSGFGNEYIVKYDSMGTIVWAKDFAGGACYDLTVDSLDNIYMSGRLISPIAFDTVLLQPPANSIDAMFIVQYDSSGHAQWAKDLSSGGYIQNGIASGHSKSVYVTGHFTNSQLVVGSDTLVRTGVGDIFVAKLSYPFTVNTSELISSKGYVVFPNPFDKELIVKSEKLTVEKSEIKLYDIFGRTVLSQQITSQKSQIPNLQNLSPGIYIYEIRNKKGEIKKGKVIKR